MSVRVECVHGAQLQVSRVSTVNYQVILRVGKKKQNNNRQSYSSTFKAKVIHFAEKPKWMEN